MFKTCQHFFPLRGSFCELANVSWKEISFPFHGRVVMKTGEKIILVKQIVLFTVLATILGFIYG